MIILPKISKMLTSEERSPIQVHIRTGSIAKDVVEIEEVIVIKIMAITTTTIVLFYSERGVVVDRPFEPLRTTKIETATNNSTRRNIRRSGIKKPGRTFVISFIIRQNA